VPRGNLTCVLYSPERGEEQKLTFTQKYRNLL
jgi:hypothetical protein